MSDHQTDTSSEKTARKFAEARTLAADELKTMDLSPRLSALGVHIEDGRIHFPYFHRMACVDPSTGDCFLNGDPAPSVDCVLLLHYLTFDCTGPARGTWISFREIPHGAPYFAAYHQRGPARIAQGFGDDEGRFERAALSLGGVREAKLPGLAFRLQALSTMPVAVILHAGEPGLPADAQLLFDASIIPMWCAEDIAVLGELTAHYLLQA